jgi:hypothetical protein
MHGLRPILLTVVLLSPAFCRAAEMCPWLNAATAGGALGGAVSMTVTRRDSNKDDANCDFVRKQGAVMYELRIEVQTMGEAVKEFPSYKAQCGSDATQLKAIGNEAVACSLDDKNGHRSALVVSRVRDRAFVIRVITTDSAMTAAALSEKARSMAEQVAGNLF